MSFLESLGEFFKIAKQTNYDLAQVYTQTPQGVYSVALVLVVILLIAYFFIRRSFKISSTLKLVSSIQDSKNIDDYNSSLNTLANELPKRGIKVAQSINAQKNEILKKELDLLKNFDIKQKIEKYQEISTSYALMAQNSKKYAIDELTSFYEQTSKSLLEVNLNEEIKTYYQSSLFEQSDVEFVNSIVKYANTTNDAQEILNPLIAQINRFSYAYNLDLFKFTMSLTKDESVQVYKNCTEKLNSVLTSNTQKVSEVILSYMLENNLKEEVYTYISNHEDVRNLKDLYFNLFGKKDDIDLDLAFISNETKIDVDYANYLDCKITDNWRDLGYIKHIMNSSRVLETIGHISYRSVLERIEKLEHEEEQNKAISEALEIARRAETLAKEAKEIARQK